MTLIISRQVLAVPNELVDVPALLPALRKCLEIGLTYVSLIYSQIFIWLPV